jgi:hypothetical protein
MWLKLRRLIIAALVIGGLWGVFSITRSGSPDREPGPSPTPGSVAAASDTPTTDVATVPSDTPAPSNTQIPSVTPAPTETPMPTSTPAPGIERDFDIVTLLPKDAILAIFDPQFLTVEEADEWYDPEELVLGVEINSETRAYSIPFLSGREIVNDTVGGRKIAVTW